jgi:surface antigen
MPFRSHAPVHHCIRACAAALTLALGGCSFSYQLDNLFAKADQGTGSLRLATPKPVADPPSQRDLTLARAAASEVLSKGGTDVSMPWENPTTGARGTVTPLASAYSQDGSVCRDFLASYVKDGGEAWLHGAGCRVPTGKWQVRTLRPWKNSADIKTSP